VVLAVRTALRHYLGYGDEPPGACGRKPKEPKKADKTAGTHKSTAADSDHRTVVARPGGPPAASPILVTIGSMSADKKVTNAAHQVAFKLNGNAR
jgi:hypothetical protein